MNSQENEPAFVGLGPVPLRDFQMQSPDQFEDVLRKMKNKQEKEKQSQLTKQKNDQRLILEQREAMSKLIERNENKQFTYDYDGKILVSKSSTKKIFNPDSSAGIQYKIGTAVSVVKKGTENIVAPQQQVIIAKNDKKNNNAASKGKQKDQTEYLNELQNQPSTYDMMLENIKPSQGVVFKGAKGEVKQGEGYNQSQNSQFDFYDTSNRSPQDVKRMTKKEYEEFIKSEGNYSRNDSFKPRKQIQKLPSHNSSMFQQNGNFDDILDNINYSRVQPIEENPLEYQESREQEYSHKQKEQSFQQQKEQDIQNPQLKRLSQRSVPSPLNQNPRSFQMAGIQSIIKQQPQQINRQPNLPSSSSSTLMKYNSFGQEQKPKKKPSAGNIQIADHEKLRSLLLC